MKSIRRVPALQEIGIRSAFLICNRDVSEFVMDVSVPDGTPFPPETLFRKTWRVRNNGTRTWDSSY